MSHAGMVSRDITGVPEGKNAFRVWLRKILRNHYLDIKRVYNFEIRTDFFELIKTGNNSNEAGNCKFIIDGDYLIMQAHSGSAWVDTGWKLKLT